MPSTPAAAVIPYRLAPDHKTRLVGALDPDARRSLAVAMFTDVIDVCLDVVDDVTVLVGDAAAAAVARTLGVAVIDDPADGGIDAAVAGATAGTSAARLVVAAADLPGLRPVTLEAALRATAPVVIAPTQDGGTALLVRSPPNVIATSYGPGSALRHAAAASAAAAEHVMLPVVRDVDTGDDLTALDEDGVGPATAVVLRTLRGARVAVRTRQETSW